MVFLSRFLLNLRRTQSSNIPSSPSQYSISSIRFPTLVDVAEDFGRPLDFGWHAPEEDEEDDSLDQPPLTA